MQATIYLWPYTNHGLGKLSVAIRDGNSQKYINWPWQLDLPNDLQDHGAACIAIQLPETACSYEQFEANWQTTASYVDDNKSLFIILWNYYHSYNLAREKFCLASGISEQDFVKTYEQEYSKLKKTGDLFAHNCAHAVRDALWSAGYLKSKPHDHAWQTPRGQARWFGRRKLSGKSVLDLLMQDILPFIESHGLPEICQKLQHVAVGVFSPQLSITHGVAADHASFGKLLEVEQLAQLLFFQKMLNKFAPEQSSQLSKAIQHKQFAQEKLHYANLLTLCYKIGRFDQLRFYHEKGMSDPDSDREGQWFQCAYFDLAQKVLANLQSYLQGDLTYQEFAQQSHDKIAETQKHSTIAVWRYKLYNALFLCLSLGVANLICRHLTGKYFPFHVVDMRYELGKLSDQITASRMTHSPA